MQNYLNKLWPDFNSQDLRKIILKYKRLKETLDNIMTNNLKRDFLLQ